MSLKAPKQVGWPKLPDELTDEMRRFLERFRDAISEGIRKIYDSFQGSTRAVYSVGPVDLSGAATETVIYHADSLTSGEVLRCTIVYTEASSADAGTSIKVGTEADDDYYYTGDSEVSQSKWDETSITLLERTIPAGESVLLTCANGKTGTGEVMVFIDIEHHYE